MTLRPRHYILLAVILALFAWNVVRYRRAQRALKSSTPAPVVTAPPTRVNTPAWTAFDQAADLRDAPDAQFQPAAKNLEAALSAANPEDAATRDVKGCQTWLQFYRQGVTHPGPDVSWKTRSQHHLDGCEMYHLDTSTQ